MKKCSKCGKELSVEYFYKDNYSADGLKSRCKKCHYEESKNSQRLWHTNHPNYYKVRSIEINKNRTKEEIANRKKYQSCWHIQKQEEFLSKYGVPYRTVKNYGLEEVVYIYKKYNYCCATCTSKNRLHIHHKDFKGNTIHGKKNKNVNNKIENLILLCQSCHMKLHNNLGN